MRFKDLLMMPMGASLQYQRNRTALGWADFCTFLQILASGKWHLHYQEMFDFRPKRSQFFFS